MIKELFLAIVIGAVLGLGVTGGYLTLNKKNEPEKKENVIISEPTLAPTVAVSASSDNNPKKTDSIKINSPEDNSLLATEKTDISGVTTPNSNIIIATASNTFIGQSSDSGKFSVSIKLDSGLNIVKVSSIEANGNQKDTQINITYSTAKI